MTVTHNEEIVKSGNDARVYRALRLDNGLEAVLVSDAECEKAGVSVDVRVGSFSDPDELPGLAHFCEHMLFLGSEKYPEEDELNKYLAANGGSTNAFTSSLSTNYHCSVVHTGLYGAVDRLAQFFIAPLMSEDCTAREMQAVSSEHDKNRSSDNWRNNQLFKVCARAPPAASSRPAV